MSAEAKLLNAALLKLRAALDTKRQPVAERELARQVAVVRAGQR